MFIFAVARFKTDYYISGIAYLKSDLVSLLELICYLLIEVSSSVYSGSSDFVLMELDNACITLSRASDMSRKKKSNFAGFLGTNSRKNRPISQEFRGSFQGKLHQKAIVKNGRFCGYFQRKFR